MPFPGITLEQELTRSLSLNSHPGHAATARSATVTSRVTHKFTYARVHELHLPRTQSMDGTDLALDRGSNMMLWDPQLQDNTLLEGCSVDALPTWKQRPYIPKLDLPINTLMRDMQFLLKSQDFLSPEGSSRTDEASSDPYRYHRETNSYQPLPYNRSAAGSLSGKEKLSARERQIRSSARPRLVYPREVHSVHFADSINLQAEDLPTENILPHATSPSLDEERDSDSSSKLFQARSKQAIELAHEKISLAMGMTSDDADLTVIPSSNAEDVGIVDSAALLLTHTAPAPATPAASSSRSIISPAIGFKPAEPPPIVKPKPSIARAKIAAKKNKVIVNAYHPHKFH